MQISNLRRRKRSETFKQEFFDEWPKCVVLGAGGHAKVVIDALMESGAAIVDCIIDADIRRWGTDLWGIPIIGGEEQLADLPGMGVTHFVIGVGTVGNFSPRINLCRLGVAHHLIPLRVIHPSAVCSPRAKILAGTVVFAGSIINADASIGEYAIINTGAIVEHDCLIGDHSHVATGAKLAGNVYVGQAVMIGAGAVIKQGVSIGDGALVGAGAVVIKDVEPGSAVAGVPAKPLTARTND
jgi:sugar O-acyltransferase (sialic acid O-acetyltransferase NeuD family)